MSMPLKVMTPEGEELLVPYLLRTGGWTEERYFTEASETRIVEFEDGELIVHSPANVRHQRVVGFITVLLRGYVRARNLGDVLTGPAVVRLRPGLDYEPDVFVVATEHQAQLGEYFSGPPSFVIEVVSEGSRSHDLRTKASSYHQFGVPEYWTVDPERRTLYRHTRQAGQPHAYAVTEHGSGRLESQAIPGFWIEVSWLWQEPLPLELGCLEQILGGRGGG